MSCHGLAIKASLVAQSSKNGQKDKSEIDHDIQKHVTNTWAKHGYYECFISPESFIFEGDVFPMLTMLAYEHGDVVVKKALKTQCFFHQIECRHL